MMSWNATTDITTRMKMTGITTSFVAYYYGSRTAR